MSPIVESALKFGTTSPSLIIADCTGFLRENTLRSIRLDGNDVQIDASVLCFVEKTARASKVYPQVTLHKISDRIRKAFSVNDDCHERPVFILNPPVHGETAGFSPAVWLSEIQSHKRFKLNQRWMIQMQTAPIIASHIQDSERASQLSAASMALLVMAMVNVQYRICALTLLR